MDVRCVEPREQIKFILKGFDSFEQIVDKELRFVYKKNDEYKELIFKAKKSDFMHLCGLKYKDPKNKKYVRAKRFYDLVKRKQISPPSLEAKEDGTTELKLRVIGSLNSILSGKVRIIDRSLAFNKVAFDGAIRSSRKIFVLGLYHGENSVYGPKSLFNLQTLSNDHFGNGHKVHKIYLINKHKEKEVIFDIEQ